MFFVLQIRSSLLSLSTRDILVMENALITLLRMVPVKVRARTANLPPFHDESVVPRVAHVLSAMQAGTFKGSLAIAQAACHILYRVIYDDGTYHGGVPLPEVTQPAAFASMAGLCGGCCVRC